MAFDFKNAFKKFVAEPGDKLNQTINNAVGKNVFGEIRPIEEPSQFAAYDTFPSYTVPEPNAWTTTDGEEKTITLSSPGKDQIEEDEQRIVSALRAL